MRKTVTAAALAGGLLVLAGCGGPTHRDADVDDRGVVKADAVGYYEIREATKRLADDIAQQNARGWLPHIKVGPYGKPIVRIAKVRNDTTARFDSNDIRNEIYNVMVEQGVVQFVSQSEDLQYVQDERDYSGAGLTDDELEPGQDATTSLALVGEVTENVISEGGTRQYDRSFNIRLVDTVKNMVIFSTSERFRKVRED